MIVEDWRYRGHGCIEAIPLIPRAISDFRQALLHLVHACTKEPVGGVRRGLIASGQDACGLQYARCDPLGSKQQYCCYSFSKGLRILAHLYTIFVICLITVKCGIFSQRVGQVALNFPNIYPLNHETHHVRQYTSKQWSCDWSLTLTNIRF